MQQKGEPLAYNNRNTSMNFWAALHGIILASMSKGQLPLVILGGIIIFMLFKMPEKDVSILVFLVLDKVFTFPVLGWTLFVLSGAGWFVTVKIQRRIHYKEMERVVSEKSNAQKQLYGKNQKTSR